MHHNILLYPVQSFLSVNIISKLVAYTIKCALSFYKKPVPGDVKNIVFFIIVIETLLILSGAFEVNPWSRKKTKKTNLLFAVWNLDSNPARDYARTPLIESFQAIYELDIFGGGGV